MCFIYKYSFLLCALILCTNFISIAPVKAQDSFTHSMNFESSKLPYNWHTSAWGDCTGVCNSGVQTRDVACKDNAGNDAPSGAAETECNHTPKPKDLRTCDLPDCQWFAEACDPHIHIQGDETERRERVEVCPGNIPGTPDEVTYIEERTRSAGGAWSSWEVVEIRDSLGGNSECQQAVTCIHNGVTYNEGQRRVRYISGEIVPGYGRAYMYGSCSHTCQDDGSWGPEECALNPEANGHG